MIEIREIRSNTDLNRFISFRNRLYSGDPCFVPDLNISVRRMFDRKRYPFFRHSKVDFFLAMEGKEIAGRIALIRNNNHISFSGEKCAFFGFFESVDDQDVANALIDKAVSWTNIEGLEKIVGPENFSTNDSCGFLVKGFDTPPVFMMPYNKPYYARLIETYGFARKLNLVSYLLPSNDTPEKIAPLIRRAEEKMNRNSILIRPVDFSRFEDEMLKFKIAYNECYSDNWGFVPLTDDEFRYQARELKKIAEAGSVLIADKNDRVIAFVCAVPDINQVLIKIKNGRLFPFGFFRILNTGKKINRMRILILGVVPEYRHTGIDALLYNKLYEYGRRKGYSSAEAGYVMDNNPGMNSILENLGGRIVKEYVLMEYACRQ